jgi:hypothetical protein
MYDSTANTRTLLTASCTVSYVDVGARNGILWMNSVATANAASQPAHFAVVFSYLVASPSW